MRLEDQLRKIVNRSLCGEEQVYLSFLQRIEEGNLIRAENEKSHFCLYFLPYNPDTQEIFIGYHKKSGLWLSPGGHIEKGETLLDTLSREIKEELDLDFDLEKINAPFMLSITEIDNPPQPCRAHYDIWYLISTDGGEFKVDSREFRETRWVTVDQARKLITDPNNIKALNLLEQQLLTKKRRAKLRK